MISTANCLRLRICMFRFNSFTYFNTYLKKTFMLVVTSLALWLLRSASAARSRARLGQWLWPPDRDRLSCLSSASQRESSGQHGGKAAHQPAALAFNQRNRAFEIWTVSSHPNNFDTHAIPSYFCSSFFFHLDRVTCCFVSHQSSLLSRCFCFCLSCLSCCRSWPPVRLVGRRRRPLIILHCPIGPRSGLGWAGLVWADVACCTGFAHADATSRRGEARGWTRHASRRASDRIIARRCAALRMRCAAHAAAVRLRCLDDQRARTRTQHLHTGAKRREDIRMDGGGSGDERRGPLPAD